MSCNKPPRTYAEQLEILKNRGLVVVDEPQALHCLEHHNYYRLSAYRFPLTVLGNPEGIALGDAVDRAEKVLKAMNLPPQYSYIFTGQAKTLGETGYYFLVAFAL